MSSVDQPSAFWQALSAEHSAQLSADGFAMVKRQQALRYFTWQWTWRRVLRSEQFSFLCRNLPISEILTSVWGPDSLSRRSFRGVDWSLIDRYFYVLATRLVWRYAQHHGDDRVLMLDEPVLGCPFPVFLGSKLISQDLANGALEVKTICTALKAGGPRQIVEIGAGYGRIAFILLTLFPEAAYTVVDIEPALSISRWYLTELFPDRSLSFLTPGVVPEFAGSADLVVSISSLQEMLPDQIAWYLRWMDRVACGGVVYLKQWERWHNSVDDVTVVFDEYPVPDRWELVHDAPAPVQTAFRERVWSLPDVDRP